MIETKEILDDHVVTLKGFAFKSAWYTESGVPIVKISDFTQDSVSLDKICYIPIEKTYDLEKYRLQKGDVLIQTVGSWEHNPNSVVGKVTRIPEHLNDSLLNQNIVKIIPKETLDNNYLYYLLKNEVFKGYIINTAQGAATQASITLDSIKDFKFNYKKLPTQRKIACILSAYDDLIENNLKRIKLLEEKALCEYKLVTDFKRTETLGQVLKLNYGKSLSADNRKPGIYPVYGSSGAVGFNESFLVKGPGVILGRKGNVGTVFWSHLDFFPIDTVYYVESEISLFFLYFNLKHSQYFDNSDAAVPGLNRTSALGNKIHLPSLDAIKAFEEYCKPIFTLINVLQQQNTKLREARDILLPKLMSGQIEV